MTTKYCSGRFLLWASAFVWTALLVLNPFVRSSLVNARPLLQEETSSPFVIVIDGGSTGSRLHIFEFVPSSDEEEEECVRRGSARANVPLSAFGRLDHDSTPLNASHVAQHLLPAFEYAAEHVPALYHESTAVYYQATAGMRLLPVPEQEAVYDALYQGLMQAPEFVFKSLKRQDITTLSGEEEGFYGAVAANYLKGTIDANMNMIPTTTNKQNDFLEAAAAAAAAADHHHHHHGPIGALDMGGSSTQIVFLPGSPHRNQDRSDDRSCQATTTQQQPHDNDTCHSARLDEMPSRLNGQDFFATSYLSYGVDQFRERLWSTWVNEHKAQVQAEDCCDAMVLENPCTFKGYEIEWEGYTLIGTGDAHTCVQEVQRLIPHPHEPDHDDFSLGSHVGGVEHPPVQGKFFAMSLYFFTLDSLRELSHPDQEAYEAINLSWPTPSIAELYNALDGLCGRWWQGDLEEIQHNAHAFTRAEVLPHRCLESVYMVTLLRDGFGFAPESRDITFTFLVDGSEVEWSLGMALALRAEQQEALLVEQEEEERMMEPTIAPPQDNKHRANATQQREETRRSPSAYRLVDAVSHHLLATVS